MHLRELSEEIEAISQRYAASVGIERDETWFLLKLQEEVGELTQAFLMLTGRARKKGRTEQELDAGFREELADVVCHVLLMARHHGVDLETEIARKWLTWARPEETGPGPG
ncbi:pyrophosphatase [Nonomuraea candida]|uniref:pyrophosphatase n=1 Tax=Nonomuraea candida TaxID=359159 RepID=UPI0005BE863E|nr:pyrophosphatase [Nonomuraea candida]